MGVSLVRVYFRDDADANTALTTTNSLALSVLPTLPRSTLPPIVLPCNESGPREAADILKILAKPDASADRPRE